MNRFDRYTSSLAPEISHQMILLGGPEHFGSIKNDRDSTMQLDTLSGYQIDRAAAATILTSVMRNTPAIYQPLFGSLPQTIVVDPTNAPVPRNVYVEPQTGIRRLSLDLNNHSNPLRDEPNAALGAAFMSATLDAYRQHSIGIKGPVIATTAFGALSQVPAAVMNQSGQPKEIVLATSVLGAGAAWWLLSELFAQVPVIAASDRMLPLGNRLIRHAANIGSLANPEPCLSPIEH